MVKELIRRANRLQQKLADNHLPHMLVYTTGMFSVVMAAVFFVDAHNFKESATFELTFRYAEPLVWGLIMGTSGILMMFGFWHDRTSGRSPALILTITFGLIGITAAGEPFSNPDGPALLSASAVYTFVGLVCGICVMACSSRIGVPHASAADHHLDH